MVSSLAKEEKSMFFVELREPNEVRRNILESLKEIVENLQRFEKFKDMRADKLAHIEKLSKIVKDINKMVSTLRGTIPQAKIRMKISRTAVPGYP